MEELIISLAIAYFVISPIIKAMGKGARKQTANTKKTNKPKTFGELINSTRPAEKPKKYILKPTSSSASIEYESAPLDSAISEIEYASSPLDSASNYDIEYSSTPLDAVGIPEGGRIMEVTKLESASESAKTGNNLLEELFGKSNDQRREQLRKAIIMKEIIDRKY